MSSLTYCDTDTLGRLGENTATKIVLRAAPSGQSGTCDMTYHTTLSHEDFILLLDTLKKAEESGIINWDGAQFVCENTQISY